MKLCTLINPIKIRSQAQPGFALMAPRHITVLFSVLAIFAAFLSFAGATKDFTFEVPKAEAATAMVDGVDPVFPNTQTRYIQRALSARHDNLYKLRGGAVRTALGEPGLVRADAPTVVWQYRSRECVLDIYYKSEDADVNYAPVVYYEVRSRQNGVEAVQPGSQSCLESLLPSVSAPRMISVSAFYKSYLK